MMLGPEHPLDVVVEDDRKEPIPNAEIEVRTAAGPLPVGARCDGAGRARVLGLPAAPWSVVVRAAGFEEVIEPKVDAGELRVVLRRLGSILVRVLEPDGAPAKDAKVFITGTALWPAREGRTGERGMVKLGGLLAGSYALRATSDELASAVEVGVGLARGEDRELMLQLGPGRRVVAHVVDAEGDDAEDVWGARVVLAEGGLAAFPLEGTTDKKGRVVLGPIAPGPASLTASADGFVDGNPVSVAATGETRVVLSRAATIAGRVVDARGRPVDGATLEVVGADFAGMPIDDVPQRRAFRETHFTATLAGPATLVPAGELGVVPGPVPPIPRLGQALPTLGARAAPAPEPWVTRGDGTFRLTPVTPGRVRVLARHPQYVEAESEQVTVASGATKEDVTVVVRMGGALEGRVVDASGRPAAGAQVVVSATGGALERTTRTGTDGSFAFAALPESVSVSVYASEDALHASARVLAAIPDGGKKEITITLPAPRDATAVTVRDDRGYPIAAAQVSVASLDPRAPVRATAFTDARGEARVESIGGLAVHVEVSAPGHAPADLRLDAAPRALDVVLDPPEILAVEARASRGGAPISGATVACTTDAGVRRATTDASGEALLRDLAAGAVRVRVSAPGYADAEARVTLKKGAGTTRLPRFELADEAIAEGRVLGPKGDPVQGARVALGTVPTYLAVGAAPAGVATTDARGGFRLGGLPEGEVTLEAYAPELGRARVTVKTTAGRAARDVTLRLVEDAKTPAAPSAPASVAVTLAETGDTREVFVAAVAEGGQAERAGVLAGDVLLEIDGAPVRSMADARARLGGPANDDAVLKLRRGDRVLSVRVGREAVRR